MLEYTALTTGTENNTPGGNVVFEDGTGVEVLDEVTVVASGSGIGNLQTSAIGGNAAWLLAYAFGALLAVGYYVDFQGNQHDAAFTYTAKVATVRVGDQVRMGVALDTTTNTQPGQASYAHDYAYGGWIEADDSHASL